MKKTLALVFLFFCSLPVYGQVTAAGNVKISGNTTISLPVPPPVSMGFPNLASGLGWTAMPNTKLQVSQGVDVSPALCPSGFSGSCHNVVDAWGGAAGDDDDEYLLITGGGHTDYGGNEVYALRYGQAVPTLVRLTNPTLPVSSATFGFIPDSATCPQGSTSPTCAPNSRHTYSNLEYVPSTHELFLTGGSLAPGGNRGVDVWTATGFASTVVWTRRDNCGNGVEGNTGSCLDTTWPIVETDRTNPAWDSVNQLLYVWVSQDTTSNFWSFNPVTHTYTRLATADSEGNASATSNAVIDSVNRYFVAVTADSIYYISLSAPYTLNTISSSTCNGAHQNYGGAAFDPIDNVIIIPSVDMQSDYVLDMSVKTCTQETWTNPPPNPTTGDANYQGLNGRFRYSAKEDAFIYFGNPYQGGFYLRRRPFATSDFQNRIATPGVVASVDFDQASEFNPASGGGGFASGPYPGFDNVYRITQDTTVRASGHSSANFFSPAQAGSWTTSASGFYLKQFGPDGAAHSFGPGSDMYFQFRVMYDTNWVTHNWGNGLKTFIIWGPIPGPSCTGDQMVLENTDSINVFRMYGSCGAPSFRDQATNNFIEQGSFPNCFHSGTPAGSGNYSNCDQYAANVWYTFQGHVHIGTWAGNNSTIEMWAAPQGQPLTNFKFHSIIGNCCTDGTNSWGDSSAPNAGLMGIQFLTYLTDTLSGTPAMHMWIDEFVISTKPLPVPQP